MCDDHRYAPAAPTRRQFLSGSAGVLAGAALLGNLPARMALAAAARPQAADGTSAYSMAMHIHSSFSEQSGSMDSQLYQAATNAVDVLWWTDHDARMEGIGYRDVTHFTSFSETGASGQGGPWVWTVTRSGPNTGSSGGGIVQTPFSPNDPVSGGALQLIAQSSSTTLAKYGYYADCHPGGFNYRDNLTGQSLLIDVLLNSGWSKGYLELLVNTSYHQATSTAPAGDYTLSYRFVPGGRASSVANGVNGVITVPVTAGAWHTVTLTPSDDLANLWPNVDYRDFALWKLTFSAASTGDLVKGHFDYLRFDRSISGQAFFNQQTAMEAVLAPRYPSVAQQQGLELSPVLPHINWFGPGVTLPSYPSGMTSAKYTPMLQNTIIPGIHQSGGLASYNHPYGYSNVPEISQSAQNSLLSQVAGTLLSSKALGADLIEVGYNLRQGVDLAHHIGLWDVLSRNAVFLTGNGTSDDHFGTSWHGIRNNWVTSAWAASTGLQDLLAALVAGRAWSGSLSKFTGTLDLLVDGAVPMGAVSVSAVSSRSLTATATAMPSGSTLQVIQGAVDYAGQAGLSPNTKIIASYGDTQVKGGQITRQVDTSAGSFVRTQVVSSAGAIIATSNPVWLLRSTPPNGIPPPRRA